MDCEEPACELFIAASQHLQAYGKEVGGGLDLLFLWLSFPVVFQLDWWENVVPALEQI